MLSAVVWQQQQQRVSVIKRNDEMAGCRVNRTPRTDVPHAAAAAACDNFVPYRRADAHVNVSSFSLFSYSR